MSSGQAAAPVPPPDKCALSLPFQVIDNAQGLSSWVGVAQLDVWSNNPLATRLQARCPPTTKSPIYDISYMHIYLCNAIKMWTLVSYAGTAWNHEEPWHCWARRSYTSTFYLLCWWVWSSLIMIVYAWLWALAQRPIAVGPCRLCQQIRDMPTHSDTSIALLEDMIDRCVTAMHCCCLHHKVSAFHVLCTACQ